MLRHLSIIFLILLHGCAVTPITEESSSVVCWQAIHENDEVAQVEAARRFEGGMYSKPCVLLADQHEQEMRKLAIKTGETLGKIFKNATR